MSLDDKTLPELEAIAAKLKTNLAREPHSKIDQVELEDVEHYIALRKKEAMAGPHF